MRTGRKELRELAPVVQTAESTFHWINHYPLVSPMGFGSTFPIDGELSVGQHYPKTEKLGPGR